VADDAKILEPVVIKKNTEIVAGAILHEILADSIAYVWCQSI
jgi:hypothetical protein